jgi:hypothetical protein
MAAVLALALSVVLGKDASLIDADKCKTMGFTEALECKNCLHLKQFKLHKEILDDCFDCCVGAESLEPLEIKQYASARLDVCN